MPDFGIGEGLAALFGGGGLEALFGGGAEALAPLVAEGTLGAAELGAGPTFLGTIADTLGAGGFDALSGAGLAGTGADVLGTAGSFLAAPEATGLAAGGIGAGLLGARADASGANVAAATG